MRFKNKVVVVTGGSSGIGFETASFLLEEGAIIYNLDVQKSHSEEINFIKCDVSNYYEIKSAVDEVFAEQEIIDILFVSAGVHKYSNLENTSLEDFDKVMSVNCNGLFYILKAIIPIMKKQKSGSILLTGSDQSFIGKANSAVYGMTKAAIAQLTKSTAIDCADYNIRVNCICPGTCDTPFLSKVINEWDSDSDLGKEKIIEKFNSAQPLKRISKPSEIGRLACFLLSPDNSYMTGSLVTVDGGYTCQ